MLADVFKSFRLVGGTALSLYRGHRLSEDIDLFTDALYGSINFEAIDNYMNNQFPYCNTTKETIIGMGKTYFVGDSDNDYAKVDVFYNDEFIREPNLIDNICFASEEDIVAMKIEVISRIGRKKDFWDIHELMEDYSVNDMLTLHEKRYPYSHDQALIKNNFSNFSNADEDFDPICLKNKHWEIIKLDMIDFVKEL